MLEQFKLIYKDIPVDKFSDQKTSYQFDNKFFSYSDACTLWCMLRAFETKQVVEIGSGYSTALMHENSAYYDSNLMITAVETNPERLMSVFKQETSSALPVNLIQKDVRTIDLKVFSQLKDNDILFVDSSHVSKYNSDLNYILFKVLPQLNSGVLIHFHDIFDYFEYPKEWIKEGIYFNEAYLLRSFLIYNNDFEIVFFSDFMEKRHSAWYGKNMPLCLKSHERYVNGKHKGKFINHINGQSLWLRKK